MDTPATKQTPEEILQQYLSIESISFDVSDQPRKQRLLPVHTKGGTVYIKLSASAGQTIGVFHINRDIENLYMAYMWNVRDEGEPTLYVISYANAVLLAQNQGWTNAPSWKQPNGGYTTSKPSDKLLNDLERYKYTTDNLKALLKQ